MLPFSEYDSDFKKTFEKSLTSISKTLNRKKDEDFVDRLSSRYTVFMLIIFTFNIIIWIFGFLTIKCWVPKHFTGGQTKYTNSYCWVRNTYYVPMDERLPMPDQPREHVIPYYQWIPFILLGQAFFFWLPSLVWHGLNQKGGVDCDNILLAAHSVYDPKRLKMVTNQIGHFVRRPLTHKHRHDSHKITSKISLWMCGRRSGAYLIQVFLFSKILYIVNVIGQLLALNIVLSTNYYFYGIEALRHFLADGDWTQSPGVAFPRVTFCDLAIRRLGNLHNYTVQCVLPINLYLEMIYMFLWFWMVFLAVLTILGFVVWLMRAVSRSDKITFIKNRLAGVRVTDHSTVEEFVDYLGPDGVFILQLIAHNTNTITTQYITASLFDSFWMYRKTTHTKLNKD